MAYLRSSLSALQQQSQMLDRHCAALEIQNHQLDLHIARLAHTCKVEKEKALAAEQDKVRTPNPLAILALEIHHQKQQLHELNEREEMLKQDLSTLQQRNSEAEQRIYDLDDFVWKKASEIAELQRTLAVSVPYLKLKKLLCAECQRVLVEEMSAQATSLPVTRRQASQGGLLLRDGLSL